MPRKLSRGKGSDRGALTRPLATALLVHRKGVYRTSSEAVCFLRKPAAANRLLVGEGASFTGEDFVKRHYGAGGERGRARRSGRSRAVLRSVRALN